MFFGDGGGVHDCGGGTVQGGGGDGVQHSGEASMHLYCGASKSLNIINWRWSTLS